MISFANCPITDPRSEPEFIPHFFPLSDFTDFAAGTPVERNEQIRLQFLATHYEVNLAFRRCVAANGANDRGEQRARDGELTRLRQRLDELMDFYAPLGIIAEPSTVREVVVNLCFTFPDESRWFREQLVAQPRRAELTFSTTEEER
jgi:hypothetical protein